MINNVFYLLRSIHFTANPDLNRQLTFVWFQTFNFKQRMFDTEFSHSPHGATKGSISETLLERFSGTEGPETANKICAEIKIALERMNALQFLTTPLSEIYRKSPPQNLEGINSRLISLRRASPRNGQKHTGLFGIFLNLGVLSRNNWSFLMKQLTCLNFGKPLTQIMLPLPIFLGFSRFFISWRDKITFRKIYLRNLFAKTISKRESRN